MIISDEIKNAINKNQPVVALESTIISHGMPYPENIETAKALEEVVRENGAIPATIAVIEGKIKVGLDDRDLEFLAKDKSVVKASRRDLPVALALKKSASTTVSATMIAANLAGIKFFATGGIGGVHRGAGQSFDISADLQELAKTPVFVVSAGPKAILDIPLTMEYLETMGVTVLGYNSDYLPAFYYRNSGCKVDWNCKNPKEAADIFKTHQNLGYRSGMLLGNPVPEIFELDKNFIENKIEEALAEAEKLGIKGGKTTPFLLGKLYEITDGESLKTNVELVKMNAKVCALIAKEFYD